MLDPSRPYNDLPLLPPEADVETRAILKKCVAARTALAELRLAGHLIPDPDRADHADPDPRGQRQLGDREHRHHQRCAVSRSKPRRRGRRHPRPRKRCATALPSITALEALKTRPLSTRIAVEVCRAITGIAARHPPHARHHADEQPHGRGDLHTARGRGAPARAAGELGAISACTRRPNSTRSSGWPSCTTSSKPSIRFRTATAAPGASSTS